MIYCILDLYKLNILAKFRIHIRNISNYSKSEHSKISRRPWKYSKKAYISPKFYENSYNLIF